MSRRTAGRIPPCLGRSKRSFIATPSRPISRSRARPRPARASGPWSRPTPTATASPTHFPRCSAPTASRCSTSPRPELLRELGWRGPILLLEGCFDGRDLETCSRLHLWHVVHDSRQIDRLAALKTDRPQRVFLKMNSGMNRLGFAPDRYRAAWLRLDALAQVEADRADDAPRQRRCRRCRGDRARARRVRSRDARPARRALGLQQRGDAALRRAPGGGRRGLGAPRHPALRLVARRVGAQRRRLGPRAGDDPAHAADRRPGARRRREHRLRQQLHRRAADAHRRRRLRLRRRLSAPRAGRQRARHAGPRRRRSHAHRRSRLDGHDHRRPRPGADGDDRQRGRPLGPRRRGTVLSIDEVATRPAPSATS